MPISRMALTTHDERLYGEISPPGILSLWYATGCPERAHPLKSGAAKRQVYRGETLRNDGCATERLPCSPKRLRICLAGRDLGNARQRSPLTQAGNDILEGDETSSACPLAP